MPKRAKAPSGFYTASEVMRKLGIGNSTLYHYVEQGKIKRVVPPDRKDGYYIKADIDKMVRAKELFILQYSSSPSEFMKASEEDIQGIYDLCVSLYGATNIPSYERRLEWYRKNPEIYFVVKQDGIVTGFVSLLYLTDDVLRQIMETDHPQPVRAEHIRLFVPGEPIDNLFLTIGVRPGLDSTSHRQHGSHLITGTFDVLEDFARKGMPVKKLYATSRTTEGIKLCRDLGFKETQLKPEDDTLRFELDPETSDSPFLEKYQQAIKRRARKVRITGM
jgi:predicted DNA-binding transcriptional regulator AlpA